MENDLRGIENYFELTGGSSYRGFQLPGVDCSGCKKERARERETCEERGSACPEDPSKSFQRAFCECGHFTID